MEKGSDDPNQLGEDTDLKNITSFIASVSAHWPKAAVSCVLSIPVAIRKGLDPTGVL